MSEADIRAAFASLIGATVPSAQVPTGETRVVEKVWTQEELAQLQALGIDPEAAKPRAAKYRLYDALTVPPDTILLTATMRDESAGRNGGRNIQTISVADFDRKFGSAFASGKKPTVTAFAAVCDAPVTVTVPKPTATDPNATATETRPNCLGFCRIAREQEWVKKGILAP